MCRIIKKRCVFFYWDLPNTYFTTDELHQAAGETAKRKQFACLLNK